jgi:hypothetical protein
LELDMPGRYDTVRPRRGPWLAAARTRYLPGVRCRGQTFTEGLALESSGPLGTLWVGLGLCAFYIALIWVNSLLGLFLTPLFIIPLTWVMDKLGLKKRGQAAAQAEPT